MIGRLLGTRYRIRGQIGEGGMASVFVALDERLNRRVAIKVLRHKWAESKELRDRFLIEAQTLSSFDHPNIIRFFDYSGDDSEELWIVTEILRGSNLSQFVEKYPKKCLHPVIASLIVDEVCNALSYAHGKGIFHRDVKPENIFILKDGRVKLMDFGIAKDSNRMRITMTGMFMGSPSYMSPEQIRGDGVDNRSDIYSLAVTFYEILSGELPFSGDNHAQVIDKIMKGNFIAVDEVASWVPSSLSKLIQKSLSFNPEDRFQDIDSFAFELRQFLNSHGFANSERELAAYFGNRSSFERKLKNTVRLRPPRVMKYKSKAPTRLRKPETKFIGQVRNAQNQARRFKPYQNYEAGKVHGARVRRGPSPRPQQRAPYRVAIRKRQSNLAYYFFAIMIVAMILILSLLGFIRLYEHLEGIRNESLRKNHSLGSTKLGEDLTSVKPINNLVEATPPSIDADTGYPLALFDITPEAAVFIDGRFFGMSNGRRLSKGAFLEPGVYEVRLEREGYRTLRKRISLKEGRVVYKYQLKPLLYQVPVTFKTNQHEVRVEILRPVSELMASFLMNKMEHVYHLPPGHYVVRFILDGKVLEERLKIKGGDARVVARGLFK